MNRNRIFSILFLMGLLGFFPSKAQVLIRAVADRDSILVGEPLHLTVEARLPLGQKYDWFTLDSLTHFEWLDKGPVQDTNDVDGKKISQLFTITSYDTGHWSIPSLSIRVGGKTYSSDTLAIKVGYSAGFNSGEEYRDIKETEEVETAHPNQWKWWALGALTLLVLLVILYLQMRKKNKGKEVPVIQQRLTPFEEAMKSLELLRADRGLPVKEYYTRLNDTLKTYLSREPGLTTFEKTNEELLQQLKSVNLPASEYARLSDALHLSDYVKFAKYEPGIDHNEQAARVIEEAIRIIHNNQSKKQPT